MLRSALGQLAEAATPGATESWRFIDSWLHENLPPFYREFSVVMLAERLRRDASGAGVDLREVEEGTPLAIERIIAMTAEARVARGNPATTIALGGSRFAKPTSS